MNGTAGLDPSLNNNAALNTLRLVEKPSFKKLRFFFS